MSEHNTRGGGAGGWAILGAALLAALGLALWLIGSETLRTLAFILIGALALALVIAAAAFPIRAWRRQDYTGETHHYHDGTKTIVKETRVIDGRAAPQTDIKLLQLPAQAPGGAFPELLRASYQAGLFAQPQGQPPRQDLRAFDFTDDGDGGGWGGDITG